MGYLIVVVIWSRDDHNIDGIFFWFVFDGCRFRLQSVVEDDEVVDVVGGGDCWLVWCF